MSQIISGIGQTKILTVLDTYVHTCQANQLYTVSVTVSEIPPSGIIVTIQQNGSQKAITSAPAASQGVINLQALLQCVQGDVISVILSSASQSDALKNSFKAVLNIRQGQV